MSSRGRNKKINLPSLSSAVPRGDRCYRFPETTLTYADSHHLPNDLRSSLSLQRTLPDLAKPTLTFQLAET